MNQATVNQSRSSIGDALRVQFERAMEQEVGSFAERETSALRIANELVRHWIERELRELAGRYEDEVLVGGQRYKQHAVGTRRYHSLSGSVEVERYSYRQVGVHNGPTVVPLEIEAGLVENATPALVASVLQAFAAAPLRHYEDEMQVAHRRIPSRSTLERIAKRAGGVLRDEAPLIEPVVRTHETVPKEARSISVGLDRTTVPMAEPSTTKKKCRVKPYVRRAPAPVEVAYRMAYVATIAVHDEDGEVLRTVRVSSTAEEGSGPLMEQVGAELEYILSVRRLPVVVVQDGAPELWGLVDEWLAAFNIPIAMRLIDRYHLDERLAKAAEAIEQNHDARTRLLRTWKRLLDKTADGAERICKRLRRLVYGPPSRSFWPVFRPAIDGPNGAIVASAFGYLQHNADRFAYAAARRRGFSIGSGPTEGACKSVIAARFKRSGQRWFEHGASPCMHLRTMHLNRRLLPMLSRHLDERAGSLVVN